MGVRHVCMHACKQDKGGLEACSPRKFLESGYSEAILGQKQSLSSYMACKVLHPCNFALHVHIYAFAKPADIERRYYIKQNSRWGDRW